MSGTIPNAEANKATVARMIESINRGEVAGFTRALSPDCVRHCEAMPPPLQVIRGPAAMHAWLSANSLTFPDYREEIECLVAEGDCVAWRSKASGTQRGPLGPFPATGRRMEIVIIGMHRFEAGRVVETWTSWDNLSALSQLGLLKLEP
jgi:predicted ester cyclase